jgi:hypothetical protein
VKWSYTQATLEFAIFKRFCNGERARRVAEALGCSRNTAMAHYRTFTRSMEDLVASMLVEERIATTPQSLDEVIQLEKALRTGSERRRARACLYLFLNSLGPEERLQELFAVSLGRELIWKIRSAEATLRLKQAGKSYDIRRCATDYVPALKISGSRKLKRVESTELQPTRLIERIGEEISEPKRTPLIESIGEEITAFIEKYYASALPSRACRKLGGMWVDVWKSCRKTIVRSGRS